MKRSAALLALLLAMTVAHGAPETQTLTGEFFWSGPTSGSILKRCPLPQPRTAHWRLQPIFLNQYKTLTGFCKVGFVCWNSEPNWLGWIFIVFLGLVLFVIASIIAWIIKSIWTTLEDQGYL